MHVLFALNYKIVNIKEELCNLNERIEMKNHNRKKIFFKEKKYLTVTHVYETYASINCVRDILFNIRSPDTFTHLTHFYAYALTSMQKHNATDTQKNAP